MYIWHRSYRPYIAYAFVKRLLSKSRMMQLDIGVVYIGLENCTVLGYYAASCVNNPEERSSQLIHGGSLKSLSLV